jgi:hypothetical protein
VAWAGHSRCSSSLPQEPHTTSSKTPRPSQPLPRTYLILRHLLDLAAGLCTAGILAVGVGLGYAQRSASTPRSQARCNRALSGAERLKTTPFAADQKMQLVLLADPFATSHDNDIPAGLRQQNAPTG